MRTLLLFSLLWAWLLQPAYASSFSANPLLSGNTQQADFLPAEQAFDLSVEPQASGETLLRWDIAPGYYLSTSTVCSSTDCQLASSRSCRQGCRIAMSSSATRRSTVSAWS